MTQSKQEVNGAGGVWWNEEAVIHAITEFHNINDKVYLEVIDTLHASRTIREMVGKAISGMMSGQMRPKNVIFATLVLGMALGAALGESSPLAKILKERMEN